MRDQNVDGILPIANNRDYSAFRTLIYVPLCRLHFGSDCNELFSAFLAMFEKFVRFLFPSNFNLLSVFFSLAHGARRCSRPHNNPVENLVEESFFPAFLHFFAPKLSITFTIYNHFKTSIYLSRVKKKKKKKKKTSQTF